MSGIDFISDTHGQGDKHEALLQILGYRGFKHPKGRHVIYVGDAPNRGNQQQHNLDLLRAMLRKKRGRGIMGNHEFKAIMFSRMGADGEYLRPHTVENVEEHQLFLNEFPFGSDKYKDAIRFFETLPLYISTKDFNVVHAFWSAEAIRTCAPYLNKDKTLKSFAYEAFNHPDHKKFHDALTLLIKGPYYSLPGRIRVVNSQMEEKDKVRYFWWLKHQDATHPVMGKKDKGLGPAFRSATLKVEQDSLSPLADKTDQFVNELSSREMRGFLDLKKTFQYRAHKPLFIGHYNLLTIPGIDNPRVVCLNYKDKVVAYRWDVGDQGLDPAKLVCV